MPVELRELKEIPPDEKITSFPLIQVIIRPFSKLVIYGIKFARSFHGWKEKRDWPVLLALFFQFTSILLAAIAGFVLFGTVEAVRDWFKSFIEPFDLGETFTTGIAAYVSGHAFGYIADVLSNYAVRIINKGAFGHPVYFLTKGQKRRLTRNLMLRQLLNRIAECDDPAELQQLHHIYDQEMSNTSITIGDPAYFLYRDIYSGVSDDASHMISGCRAIIKRMPEDKKSEWIKAFDSLKRAHPGPYLKKIERHGDMLEAQDKELDHSHMIDTTIRELVNVYNTAPPPPMPVPSQPIHLSSAPIIPGTSPPPALPVLQPGSPGYGPRSGTSRDMTAVPISTHCPEGGMQAAPSSPPIVSCPASGAMQQEPFGVAPPPPPLALADGAPGAIALERSAARRRGMIAKYGSSTLIRRSVRQQRDAARGIAPILDARVCGEIHLLAARLAAIDVHPGTGATQCDRQGSVTWIADHANIEQLQGINNELGRIIHELQARAQGARMLVVPPRFTPAQLLQLNDFERQDRKVERKSAKYSEPIRRVVQTT